MMIIVFFCSVVFFNIGGNHQTGSLLNQHADIPEEEEEEEVWNEEEEILNSQQNKAATREFQSTPNAATGYRWLFTNKEEDEEKQGVSMRSNKKNEQSPAFYYNQYYSPYAQATVKTPKISAADSCTIFVMQLIFIVCNLNMFCLIMLTMVSSIFKINGNKLYVLGMFQTENILT